MREGTHSRVAWLLLLAACGPSPGASSDAGESTSTASTSVASTDETSTTDSNRMESSTTESSTSSSTTTSADSTSTGATPDCLGGGNWQLVAGHRIDLSAWPADETPEGTTWIVDTDCAFVEVTSGDTGHWHFSCPHPFAGTVDLDLELDCFFGPDCALDVEPGQQVHLLHHARAPVTESWTVLRDVEGSLLFIGVDAHGVEFPGGPADVEPLFFELAPLESCAPTFECGNGAPRPILVSAGADSQWIYDSDVAVLDLDGASYNAAVELSCSGLGGEDDSYAARFLVTPA